MSAGFGRLVRVESILLTEALFGVSVHACSNSNTMGGAVKKVTFDCFSYQSEVFINLIDEFTSNLIGTGKIPVFGIIEKKTQYQYKSFGGMRKEMIFKGGKRMELSETLKNLQTPPDDYEWVQLKDGKGNITGKVLVSVQFDDENLLECFSPREPSRVGEDVDKQSFKVESLRVVLVRCAKIYKWKQHLYEYKAKIVGFHDTRVSLAWLFGSLLFCYCFDAEYLPCYVGLFTCFFMLNNLKKRMSGSSIMHLLQDEKSSHINRFVGKLRIAVDRCENLPYASKRNNNVDPLVRVWLSCGLSVRNYIGRTRTCKDTCSPMFQKAHFESNSRQSTIHKGKQWLLSRSMKTNVRDAALHNVTSSWKHEDGRIDWHCLKYPILQDVANENSTHAKVLSWDNSFSQLEFDVAHASQRGELLLGRVKIPITDLLSDSRGGGVQELREFNMEIQPVAKEGKEVSTLEQGRNLGTLRVRVQLKVEERGQEFTELDKMNQDRLEDMLNDEVELGIVGKLNKVKDLATQLQVTLEGWADWFERVKNLMCWVHPMKTLIVLLYILCGCVVCRIVKFRYLLTYRVLNDFRKGYLRKRSRNEWNNRVNNLLSTLPTDKNMEDIFELERKAIAEIKAGVGNDVALQSLWQGNIWKKGLVNTSFKNRFVVIRNGKILWWTSEKNAERGVMPRGQLYIVKDFVEGGGESR